jgi:hypothetical protein
MTETITPDDFLDNTAWAICSTYNTVRKASPGAAIFGRDMLFDIPFIADWNKIGNYRQCQTDLNTACKDSSKQVNYDYKVGNKVLKQKRYPSQSRKSIQQRAMGYQNSSYYWNYQDSMQNTIGKT